jgi:hypothetical protein
MPTRRSYQHVQYALRYHNETVDEFDLVWGVVNGLKAVMKGEVVGFGRQRKAALGTLEAVAERTSDRGAWQGDTTLSDALSSLTKRGAALVEGPATNGAELGSKKRQTAKDRAALQSEVDAFSAEVLAMSADQAEAMAAFKAGWHLEEYLAWRAQIREAVAGGTP